MVATVKFSDFTSIDLNNSTNVLVGTSSPLGGVNIKADFTTAWTTAGRPTSPYPGLMGYNSTIGAPEYWDGLTWIQLTTGGGNITLINTGTGLTGGPITTSGTISFAAISAMSLWANTTGANAVPTVTPLSDFLLSANNLSELTDVDTARGNLFLASGRGTAGQVLVSNGALIEPTWQSNMGSGVVGPGLINELAWYDATGNAVNGLPTEVLGVLVTNASGVPSISNGGQIPGTTTNNAANVGNVGELIFSPYASGIAMNSSGPVVNVTSIVLTPGDWDVWGQFNATPAGTGVHLLQLGISATSATLPVPSTPDTSSLISDLVNFISVFNINYATGTAVIKVPTATTLTVYLVARFSLDGGKNLTGGGIVMGRRRR